jgi:putative transposase
MAIPTHRVRYQAQPSRDCSREYLCSHVLGHIGQVEVAAAVAVPEALVVEAQKSKECRVHAGGVHPAFDRAMSKFVGRTTSSLLRSCARFAVFEFAPVQAVLRRTVRGVSTRDYEGVIDVARDGFGVAKSSISRSFVRASAADVKALAERRFDGERFAVVMIDGVEYAGETMVVALGITEDGTKRVLGLRQGATENAAVCTALLEDLRERGLETGRPTLFVLDGAKALHAAVTRVWGKNAVIQRCQVHKRRNLKAHVPEKHWPELERRLSEAYHETHYATAKASLEGTARWLDRLNADAAASLREGLEETLTVVRLGMPGSLRRTLATTNPIESALSVTRRVTARVTRWRDGDMRRRWCVAGLLRAEEKFRRVKGHRAMPALLKALEVWVRKQPSGSERDVA